MRLPLLFLLLHLFVLLRLLHRLFRFYHLPTPCPYLSLLCLGGLNSAIHHCFQCHDMWESMRHIWIRKSSTEMCESDPALTVPDRHNVLHGMNSRAWVKRWLHCGGSGLSLSHCVGSEVDCSFVCCYKEVKYETWDGSVDACTAFWWTIVTQNWYVAYRFGSSVSSLLIRRMIQLLGVCLRLWDSIASSRMRMFHGWNKAELFAVTPSHRILTTLRLRFVVDRWSGLASFAFRRRRSLHSTAVTF